MRDFRQGMAESIRHLISDEMVEKTWRKVEIYKARGISVEKSLSIEFAAIESPEKSIDNPNRVEMCFNALSDEDKRIFLFIANIDGDPKPLASYTESERALLGDALKRMRELEAKMPKGVLLSDFKELSKH